MENSLNEREKEILELVKQNLSIDEIAEKYGVSRHTIKSYLSKFNKMHII